MSVLKRLIAVMSVREIRNKSTSPSSNMYSTQNFALLTVYQVNNTGMDILNEQTLDNYDEMRGRLPSHYSSILRDTSIFSTRSSVTYHNRMKQNNGIIVNKDLPNNDTSPELSYKTTQEKALHLSKATENQLSMRPMHANLTPNTPLQCDSGNHPNMLPLQGMTVQNEESTFINILLSYDLNTPTNPKIWDGRFHLIFFHGSIKHIVLDAKSIKESLKFIAKYISNKQVESSKVNDLDNFNSISNAVWNFISSVYDTNWDALFTDNKSNTLRKKITAKFTPKIHTTLQKDLEKFNKPIPASIEKISLPIPAKSQKKVNIISKFFKNKKSENMTSSIAKSYA